MVPQVVIVVVVQVTYRSYRKNIFSELPSISQLLKSPQAVTYFLTLKAGSSEEFLESSNLSLNSQQSVKLFIIHFRPPPPFVPPNQSIKISCLQIINSSRQRQREPQHFVPLGDISISLPSRTSNTVPPDDLMSINVYQKHNR